MLLLYSYLIVIILCYTLNPFLKKMIVPRMNNTEYLILNHILITVFILLYGIYAKKRGECNLYNSYNNLSNKDLVIFSLGAITTILASIMLLNLVRLGDVSYIVPHIQSIVIVITLLFGYIIYKEPISNTKFVGIILILLGILIINHKPKII